jgi:hypothetical protein
MTGKRLASLFKRYLRAGLPQMEQRGSLVYRRPIGDLLCGCHFESSGFGRDRFVLHAFVQPLYVPAQTVVLSFGRRLGERGERWFDLGEQPEAEVMGEVLRLIQMEVVQLCARFRGPFDFADHGAELASNPRDPYFLEAVAYSHALAGGYDRASAEIARLLAGLQSKDELLPWEREMIRRNQQLDARLRDCPEGAVADLRGWRDETLRAIGLRDDPVPLLA